MYCFSPCSTTGIIRRHADIHLLRQTTDIPNIIQLQSEILNNMWKNLNIGGYLLYITCSIFKSENTDQIKSFVSQHSDAQEVLLNVSWGIPQEYGYQLLPLQGGDGFYYCLLYKTAA